MSHAYPSVKNDKLDLCFSNGEFCSIPKEYLKASNKQILNTFYSSILSESSNKDLVVGIDPLGFTFLNLDFICYVGLITYTNEVKRGKYRNLGKKYPLNKFDLEYLKKKISFEYNLLNFKEYVPIDILTQNVHEIRGLNSKIAGNIDRIMKIDSEVEWEAKFDEQSESVKKIYVGSRLIKFLLDNVKFYQPDFFKNLKIKYDQSFVVHRSVSKIVKIYSNDFKKGRADIELSGSLSKSITGEKEYFEILIKTLIENALKYSEFPKRIAPQVEISESKKRINIAVKSYGRAIPKTEIPYLFSKGFRSSANKQLREGTGMGLYNASQIAKHFYANIVFDSKDASEMDSINLAWNVFTLKIDKSMHVIK